MRTGREVIRWKGMRQGECEGETSVTEGKGGAMWKPSEWKLVRICEGDPNEDS